MATPLSAVKTNLSVSPLSSPIACAPALLRLDFEGLKPLRTLFILILISSTSCWLSLVHSDSMAVIYSRLGMPWGYGIIGSLCQQGPLSLGQRLAGYVNSPLMTGVFQGNFPLARGEPLKGMDWACPSWGSQGTCPPVLCPCSLVISVVLFGEEAASPAVVPEVPWLGLRHWSA